VIELADSGERIDWVVVRRYIDRTRELGCRIALDDFGTGYGGFTYLKKLDVDCLKIDVEFVADLVVSDASRHVVKAVVNLARSFGLRTVAEGVEDGATLDLLRTMGVDYAQGYHLGRPAPLELMDEPGSTTFRTEPT
jgi:EAL domain-containing protein (putative c-di-GMP-specific phosphodiesterase class I)